MKWLPQKWNDTLSILLLAIIVAVWLLAKRMELPAEVIGATIAWGGLVVAFYYRKAGPSEPKE